MTQEHPATLRDPATSAAMLGLTLGVLAAAAGGAYLFLGKDGARNRRKLTEWARARLEARDVNRDMVLAVIAGLARRFTRFTRLSAGELAEALESLEAAWRALERTHGRKSPKLAGQK